MANNLSGLAWSQAINTIDAIREHPFNLALSSGELPAQFFGFYIEQDSFYLKEFARALAIIASRVPDRYRGDFLYYSDTALAVESGAVHEHFRQSMNLRNTGIITQATIDYSQYLIRIAQEGDIAVAIAAALPCFWVYLVVGSEIAESATLKDHPYERWISTYSGQEFERSVDRMIEIFDEVGSLAPPATQEQMVQAFYISCQFEWQFVDDCYSWQIDLVGRGEL